MCDEQSADGLAVPDVLPVEFGSSLLGVPGAAAVGSVGPFITGLLDAAAPPSLPDWAKAPPPIIRDTIVVAMSFFIGALSSLVDNDRTGNHSRCSCMLKLGDLGHLLEQDLDFR